MVKIIKITGIITLILLIILVLTTFIIVKTGALDNFLKNKIESELSIFLNRDVKIQNIEGGIFNHIVLNNVKITSEKGLKNETTIIIDKIIMNFSVKDIIFDRNKVINDLRNIQIKL